MLQTANVLKPNFTRPISCRVLAVKCSKNDHENLEECFRQLTRMMDLMPSDFTCLCYDSKPTKQGTMSDRLLGLSNRPSSHYFQERSSTVTFILKFFCYRIVNLLNISSVSPKFWLFSQTFRRIQS